VLRWDWLGSVYSHDVTFTWVETHFPFGRPAVQHSQLDLHVFLLSCRLGNHLQRILSLCLRILVVVSRLNSKNNNGPRTVPGDSWRYAGFRWWIAINDNPHQAVTPEVSHPHLNVTPDTVTRNGRDMRIGTSDSNSNRISKLRRSLRNGRDSVLDVHAVQCQMHARSPLWPHRTGTSDQMSVSTVRSSWDSQELALRKKMFEHDRSKSECCV